MERSSFGWPSVTASPKGHRPTRRTASPWRSARGTPPLSDPLRTLSARKGYYRCLSDEMAATQLSSVRVTSPNVRPPPHPRNQEPFALKLRDCLSNCHRSQIKLLRKRGRGRDARARPVFAARDPLPQQIRELLPRRHHGLPIDHAVNGRAP